MIQIDIDMPKNCFECDKTYKWKKIGKVQCPHINMPSISSDTTNRPSYCPLKELSDNSVLKDIEAGHNSLSVEFIDDNVYVLGKDNEAVQAVIKTIHKYQKMIEILEKVWNIPSCMIDKSECLDKIMETYRTVRRQND
jgi:hypothetical protein